MCPDCLTAREQAFKEAKEDCRASHTVEVQRINALQQASEQAEKDIEALKAEVEAWITVATDVPSALASAREQAEKERQMTLAEATELCNEEIQEQRAEAREQGRLQGRREGMEEAAKIAEQARGGYTANVRVDESEQELVPDEDGPWVLNADVARAIRASALLEKEQPR